MAGMQPAVIILLASPRLGQTDRSKTESASPPTGTNAKGLVFRRCRWLESQVVPLPMCSVPSVRSCVPTV